MKIIKKVAPNCGYIIQKDRKEVVFYTHDLINTPIKYCLYSTNESHSEEAIRCLGGLVNFERQDEDCRNISNNFVSCNYCYVKYICEQS